MIPRDISRWFDKLDLTYAVRNLSRDLANGFVVAEIISRYPPKEKEKKDLDIYTFYNSLSIEKRLDNWKRIADVLKHRGHKISVEDYEPVIYLKKDAALNFIKRYTSCDTDCMRCSRRRPSQRKKNSSVLLLALLTHTSRWPLLL